MKILIPAIVLAAAPMFAAEPTSTAAGAINALGIDLLHQAGKPDANLLLSPYSIQSALAMTCAGADGATREEMARVLHYPKDDVELNGSFAELQKALDELMQQSAMAAERFKQYGRSNDPVILTVANRLFGQAGYDFRTAFLESVKTNYGAPFEQMDFVNNAAGATKRINGWVEDQTRKRIRDLIPAGALNTLTRLVLVNAIYLKAPWAQPFHESATRPGPFHVGGGAAVEVPTMMQQHPLSYAKRDGFIVVAIPYSGGELQFLILLPDQTDGLAALEKRLTADRLNECANLPAQEVLLHLPRFKLEPPVMSLSGELKKLGMKSAFDEPAGSANFDRMAPRRPGDYLYLSDVFHKTFLALDEKGTEAAAATAAIMVGRAAALRPPKPVEVNVDHPFLFAIQHRPSGACLFLGRVTDPR